LIQILGLRTFVDKKTGEVKLYDSHFNNGWRVESVRELFADIEHHVSQIPQDARWNMFYTTSHCEERKGRVFIKQDVLPIDIDGIEPARRDEYVDIILAELELERNKVGIVSSGNGLHFLLGLPRPIEDVTYFKANRVYYKALCGRINQALYEKGLSGSADPSVFSAARLLRLPLTVNKKEGKPDTQCQLINGNIDTLDVDLVSLSKLPRLFEGDFIHQNAFKRFPDPDTEAVQQGCGFLNHCFENQSKISEPEWYGMISIVGRLKDGDKLVHQYSEGHPGYHPDSTDYKLEHALGSSGPRTCENISSMFGGCVSCPHYNKITSPIQIVGEDYIKTKDTGFYNVQIKNGVATTGKPNYDDLLKFYDKENPYITIEDSQETYKYNDIHWEHVEKSRIHNFAEHNFKPSPSNSMCCEFESKIKRTNLRPHDFLLVKSKLNFKNGILDLNSGEIQEHTPEEGFTYVIPYGYDPSANNCPNFDKFMDDVMCGDEKLIQLLLEYMGFCLSGESPKLVQKCAVLHGGGSNGKSVLLDLMGNLVGEKNFSSVSMGNMAKDTGRYQMMHKLFNVSAETPTDSFLDSSHFKAIVGGDPVEVRQLYHQAFMWEATIKLMFACNELPYTKDFSHGMYRRLLIIPFKATFSDLKGNKDPFILQKMLKERTAILNKCLKAYNVLKERGYRFDEPEAVIREMEEYKEMGDTILRFTNELCDYDSYTDRQLDINTAYRCYVAWSEDIRAKPVAYGTFVRRFGTCLSDLFPKVKKERIRNGNKRVTVYTGVTIAATSGF
jgi:putative DNA primase/helicase